jgi:zinc protease
MRNIFRQKTKREKATSYLLSYKRAALLLLCFFQGCEMIVSPSSPLESGLEHVHFIPPEPESWKLNNGMTVLYLPDRELPFVRGALYMPGGDLWEQEGKDGSVATMGHLLRRGGAGDLSPDELDEVLEKLSANISSGFGEEFGSVAFSCLRQDFKEVFSHFADVVRRPRFEGDRLALFKLQKLEQIRRRKDDPETIASLSLTSLLYGTSPYGRVLTSESITALSREDVLSVYKEFVSPASAIFTITGDITRTEVQDYLEKHFGDWISPEEKDLLPPPVKENAGGKLVFIEGPFTQATVVMAQLGVPRLTPDRYAITVFNRIFGVGLGTSRLYQRVRSDLGLAYSVYGFISPSVVRGINSIYLQTKAESAGVGIVESLATLRQLGEAAPGEEELSERKLAAINSFVFANDSTDATLQRQALFTLYGYPMDNDRDYIGNIEDVDPGDILEVAQSRWQLENLTIVVVGPQQALTSVKESFEKIKSLMGKIEIIEASFDEQLTIPG